MDVLFAAILAVPVILGELPSFSKLLGHIYYHKWDGRKEIKDRVRGAVQWGSDNTLICARVQSWGWRGIWKVEPEKGVESRILSKKRPLTGMEPWMWGVPNESELSSPSPQR